MTPADFVERLDGVVRTGDGRWISRCPGHEDKRPSLSFCEGRDGRTLLRCHAGCEVEEVVHALGLTLRDLFPPRDDRCRPVPARRLTRAQLDEVRARELIRRLGRVHRPPKPARMRKELRGCGRLILGGTEAFARVPPGFDPETIQTWPLRLLFYSMGELVQHGTPRRWFSPLALATVIDFHAGPRDFVFPRPEAMRTGSISLRPAKSNAAAEFLRTCLMNGPVGSSTVVETGVRDSHARAAIQKVATLLGVKKEGLPLEAPVVAGCRDVHGT